MSGWRAIERVVAGVAAVALLSACGSAARQDASEPNQQYTVSIPVRSFPASQHLSQHTHLVIAVRNDSSATIPDIAITICNVTCAYNAPAGEGTSAQAFADCIGPPGQSCVQAATAAGDASSSRPIWIIDHPPGVCSYSCQGGGAGSAASAYSNTWALGPLAPGATAKFVWTLTAVAPGRHVVAWQIAAGLNGRAKAVLSDGATPSGRFAVTIKNKPAQTYVNNAGQIVPAQ